MKKAITVLLGVVFVGITAGSAAAKTCSGHWGGREATSITFKSADTLRYCYMNNCSDVRYQGDARNKVTFKLRSGAVVNASAKGANYAATWQTPDGRSALANLKCG